MDMLQDLIPQSLPLVEAVFLIVVAGLTSMITASFGIGGGAMLIAIMAQIVPVAALIPVHGLVQFGSNFNRALFTYKNIDYRWVKFFLYGSIVGAILATFIVAQLSLTLIQITIGVFILWMIWGPKPKYPVMSQGKIILAGGVTTLVSMFVGATGPLVAGLIYRAGGEKLGKVATMAAALTVQHILKIFVFTVIGFSFLEWLPLILAMIISGAIGTWLGLHVLRKISSEAFNLVFRIVITALAFRLIYQGVGFHL